MSFTLLGPAPAVRLVPFRPDDAELRVIGTAGQRRLVELALRRLPMDVAARARAQLAFFFPAANARGQYLHAPGRAIVFLRADATTRVIAHEVAHHELELEQTPEIEQAMQLHEKGSGSVTVSRIVWDRMQALERETEQLVERWLGPNLAKALP